MAKILWKDISDISGTSEATPNIGIHGIHGILSFGAFCQRKVEPLSRSRGRDVRCRLSHNTQDKSGYDGETPGY
jgi:hypothetical protein